MKQQAGESVQSYIHRFNRLVRQRGLDNDEHDSENVTHFVLHLLPSMHKEYLRWQTQQKCNVLMSGGDGIKTPTLTLKRVQDDLRLL